jgi:hypothetical protein
MGVHRVIQHIRPGVLLITPGDREDILLAVATAVGGAAAAGLAGVILTGDLRPSPATLRLLGAMPFPVLLAKEDSYRVASRVHDLTVKTRPSDTEKIHLIRDLVAQHVDVQKILNAL